MNDGITVIIPTYRNPKYLSLCLRSAIKGKKLKTTEIIVVVDGFYSESQEVLELYKEHINVFDLGSNRGMGYAINIGAYNANNSSLLICNDDNVFAKNWDENISNLDLSFKVWTLEQIETSAGMFNFTVANFGKTPEEFQYDEFIKFCEENQSNMDTLKGEIFPYLISRKNFMACGGFDLLFSGPCHVDWDHFLKLELMGLQFRRTYKTMLYHFGSVVTKQSIDSNMFSEKFKQTYNEFIYKWKFPPYNGTNNTKIPPNIII